jgi:phosphatidylserine decarboxylase
LNFHRHPSFLRLYGLLPHAVLNRGLARLTRVTRPRWAVRRAISIWSRRAAIDLSECESREYTSVDDFFLRRLKPGSRPLGRGFVSPVDAKLLALGTVSETSVLSVKGQELTLERLVNAGGAGFDLRPYWGGRFAVLFLTPRGYHYVHMPCDGVLEQIAWVAGRYFPQNEDALRVIARVHERNERAVLRCTAAGGQPFLMVLVGASLIGGIHLTGLPRQSWIKTEPVTVSRSLRKGDELGWFTFGSTVIVLLPRTPSGAPPRTSAPSEVRMGQTLF